MKNNMMNNCDCYAGIDRMINEGLGGGFILYDYDEKKFDEAREAGKEQH